MKWYVLEAVPAVSCSNSCSSSFSSERLLYRVGASLLPLFPPRLDGMLFVSHLLSATFHILPSLTLNRASLEKDKASSLLFSTKRKSQIISRSCVFLMLFWGKWKLAIEFRDMEQEKMLQISRSKSRREVFLFIIERSSLWKAGICWMRQWFSRIMLICLWKQHVLLRFRCQLTRLNTNLPKHNAKQHLDNGWVQGSHRRDGEMSRKRTQKA